MEILQKNDNNNLLKEIETIIIVENRGLVII
jgi:hypothetical protein